MGERFSAVIAATMTLGLGLCGTSAVAQTSDSLQVGSLPASTLSDSDESGGKLTLLQSVAISEPGQSITGFASILLTEPGDPSVISDIVSAGIDVAQPPATGFTLNVFLTSDTGNGLIFGGGTPIVESIPETGGVQDLSAAFTDFFDLDTSLPAINVMSVEEVPEPSTWAMMLIGFAGLGYAAYRRTKRDSVGKFA
jgi:hypothetical protein